MYLQATTTLSQPSLSQPSKFLISILPYRINGPHRETKTCSNATGAGTDRQLGHIHGHRQRPGVFRGNHWPNTTRLTHVFFKRGESCSE